jgi:hypothetical protein
MGLIHYRLATPDDIDALVQLRFAFLAEVGRTSDAVTSLDGEMQPSLVQ